LAGAGRKGEACPFILIKKTAWDKRNGELRNLDPNVCTSISVRTRQSGNQGLDISIHLIASTKPTKQK
jgi:hypothetical protein